MRSPRVCGWNIVLRVEGVVVRRLAGKENPALTTGEIEVEALAIEVLNPAKVTPFPIADHVSAEEALRLRYRYLDMRRESMRANVVLAPPGRQVHPRLHG